MSDQKEQFQEKGLAQAKAVEYENERISKICPRCHTKNDPHAKFCAECGTNMATGGKCPACGSAQLPGADVCESCGSWMRPGQCVFCNSAIGEGDSYCGNCGNPPYGVVCPGCQQMSIFDYCPNCAQTLTPRALELQAEQATDRDFLELSKIVDQLAGMAQPDASMDVEQPKVIKSDGGVKALREYRQVVTAQQRKETSPVKRTLFTEEDKNRLSALDREIAVEQQRQEVERQRQEEEARRQREEERRRKAEERRQLLDDAKQLLGELSEKHKNRQFPSSQAARLFYMSLLHKFPKDIIAQMKMPTQTAKGWRCNIAGVTHQNPSQCSVAYGGGVWIF